MVATPFEECPIVGVTFVSSKVLASPTLTSATQSPQSSQSTQPRVPPHSKLPVLPSGEIDEKRIITDAFSQIYIYQPVGKCLLESPAKVPTVSTGQLYPTFCYAANDFLSAPQDLEEGFCVSFMPHKVNHKKSN